MKSFLFSALAGLLTLHASAQDRPNILWLVCEDMSPYLSCYGNKSVSTPNLDRLAAQGIRYTQAHSNGTQCSPSRSTLISGKYAISLGTDIHREKRAVPDSFYFPRYMRQAGYYTSNNNKQDYNNKKTPADVWNESSNKASYTNRTDKSQPFFSVFNCGITHMSRVATRNTEGRSPRTVSPDAVKVPAYVPDLPAVRDDIAWNMDAVMLMDKWMGRKLEELKQSGEADNTIIFFYSDHGGTVPRGKAYVYESGTRIPLIVYFPPKWKHLAGSKLPAISSRLVSFIDFPETVLNLAGIKQPSYMVGKPFLGPQVTEAKKYILTFRANQSDSYCPSRGITDGRYKLMWNYQSAYPHGTRQDYQWQMPAQQAWDVAHIQGKLKGVQEYFWKPVATWELYDLRKDSLETVNLANNPAYASTLKQLKTALQEELRRNKDLGFIPREYRLELQKQGSLYDVVRKNNIDVNREIEAAENASQKSRTLLKTYISYLDDKDPVVQYWGASGINGLARESALGSVPGAVLSSFKNTDIIPEVKVMLAEAMVYADKDQEGLNYLVKMVREQNFGPAAAALQNLGSLAKPVVPQIQAMLAEKSRKSNRFYLRSVLINCDALPYSSLYVNGEGAAD